MNAERKKETMHVVLVAGIAILGFMGYKWYEANKKPKA